MSAVSILESIGLSLRLDGEGGLVLDGMKNLPPEDRAYALKVARGHKAAIVEALQNPSPAALAHARRMTIPCPASGDDRHIWHCSRCGAAGRCTAWRSRRSEVEFFRGSEEPFSLFLVEGELGLLQ
jgi:hypothetical protein